MKVKMCYKCQIYCVLGWKVSWRWMGRLRMGGMDKNYNIIFHKSTGKVEKVVATKISIN